MHRFLVAILFALTAASSTSYAGEIIILRSTFEAAKGVDLPCHHIFDTDTPNEGIYVYKKNMGDEVGVRTTGTKVFFLTFTSNPLEVESCGMMDEICSKKTERYSTISFKKVPASCTAEFLIGEKLVKLEIELTKTSDLFVRLGEAEKDPIDQAFQKLIQELSLECATELREKYNPETAEFDLSADQSANTRASLHYKHKAKAVLLAFSHCGDSTLAHKDPIHFMAQCTDLIRDGLIGKTQQ